jgi:Fe2+ or Zn2+ uptake regulation protein
MEDYRRFEAAVALVRRAGVIPTPARLAVAQLLLDQHGRTSLDHLADQAADRNLGLSRDGLAAAFAALRPGMDLTSFAC